MCAKKKVRRKSKKSNNSLFVFIAIVIVLAIISIAIAYFFMGEQTTTTDKPVNAQTNMQTEEIPKDVKTTLEGTWVSNYDGVMLTISGLNFTLESPSVDASSKISGVLSVEENIVTFVYRSGLDACKNAEGHYLYTLEDSGDLLFNLIKDSCQSRKERMTASWFKI